MPASDVFEIDTVSTHSELREVIQLTKRASATLGFLRNEAFVGTLFNQSYIARRTRTDRWCVVLTA